MIDANTISRHSISCLGPHGFHRMAYTQWGDPLNQRVAICVHGLTRNGRDFDFLARVLRQSHRVACPDMAGRGESDWLEKPEDYVPPVYMADCAALIARLGVERVDWIGTSMGGLIGMLMAAQPGSPIRRLVINDIGPVIPGPARERIAEYVGADPRFANLKSVEQHLRQVHAPFGPLTDGQWRHLAEHGARRVKDQAEGGEGAWRLHHDPGIAAGFGNLADTGMDLWPLWDRIACPVLLIRGENSDLLPREVALEMTARGPKAKLMEIAECGHAPALMDDAQTEAVRRWLVEEQ